MTWNREEALGAAWALDASIGTPASNRAQTAYNAARQLEAAVELIDRQADHITKLVMQHRGHDWTTEVTELRSQLAAMTAERDKLRADYAGWSEYADDLSNQIAAITSERDTLRQQLAEATASLEFADRTASAQLEHVRGLEQRIAELEAADESSKFAIKSIAETHNRQTDEVYALQAILRAIYPVYRAADPETLRTIHEDLFAPFVGRIAKAFDTARAALTPDLIAALKAAGVEVE